MTELHSPHFHARPVWAYVFIVAGLAGTVGMGLHALAGPAPGTGGGGAVGVAGAGGAAGVAGAVGDSSVARVAGVAGAAGVADTLAVADGVASAEAEAPSSLPASSEAAAREQRKAGAATDAQVGMPPWQGPVTQRPAFVSETEWQVLQGVARQRVDYERELLRLVNNLRFNKLLERWRKQAAAGDGLASRVLAGQLLDELPERVRRQEYGVAEAEKLQRELLAVLEPDPARRAARAAEEAARLRPRLLLQEGGAPGR